MTGKALRPRRWQGRISGALGPWHGISPGVLGSAATTAGADTVVKWAIGRETRRR